MKYKLFKWNKQYYLNEICNFVVINQCDKMTISNMNILQILNLTNLTTTSYLC